MLRRQFAGLPINTVAQIYALKNKTSVLTKLTPDERSKLPNLQIEKPATIVQKQVKNNKREHVKQFIKFDTNDSFIIAHVNEINKCYTYGCYTAAFILCRKVIENMLTDTIKKRYPTEIDLYFDTSRGRTRDFSEIIKNLRKRSADFGPDKKLLERALNKSEQFKDDANDKAHSWFHIVRNAKELDDTHVQDIIEMLKQLLTR